MIFAARCFMSTGGRDPRRFARNRPATGSSLEWFDIALATAREAWPAIAVDEAAFARRLEELVGNAAEPAAALAELHVADMYLTVACACGNRAALDALERDYISELRTTL